MCSRLNRTSLRDCLNSATSVGVIIGVTSLVLLTRRRCWPNGRRFDDAASLYDYAGPGAKVAPKFPAANFFHPSKVFPQHPYGFGGPFIARLSHWPLDFLPGWFRLCGRAVRPARILDARSARIDYGRREVRRRPLFSAGRSAAFVLRRPLGPTSSSPPPPARGREASQTAYRRLAGRSSLKRARWQPKAFCGMVLSTRMPVSFRCRPSSLVPGVSPL